ncbi:hypothetical protein QBC34DRAFT_403710 [Podospora aff. communis PSN243]|uniref:Wax synthase domain-containing protein n=1 Tax=Podospora aff. communis PSN243 TaxID=3040156 RepID=A0AAV9GQ38_9PEZI|nr:hypothetical protein QBC34DRAFT_403710 [Podospora aff. communis PSN243]
MSEYIPLTSEIWPQALAPAVFLVFFLLPPSPFRRLTYLAAFLLLFYRCFFMSSIPHDWLATRSVLAFVWMLYLDWLAKMALHNPEHDFWRTGHPAHEAERMKPGIDKLGWAVALLASPRGIGWNFQLTKLQPRQRPAGRWRFTFQQLLRAVTFAGFSNFVGDFMKKQDAASTWGFRRAAVIPGVALKFWLDAHVLYALCDSMFMALGYAEEQDCIPPFDNNLTSLDSLQEFWGQFWHQTFRRMFQNFGRAVAWLLGIRPYSLLSGIVQTWTAFTITGVVHGLAMSSPLGTEASYAHFWAVFGFFILQAVGLTIESLFLITPARDITLYEVGLEDEMIIGRLWTFGWLLLSGYWALDSWSETSWSSVSMFAAMVPWVKRPSRPSRT